jgi:hypothetical protein
MIKTIGFYLKNVIIGVDQLGNTVINGMPDETISSRIGRNKSKWYWKPLYKVLDFIQPRHCERAVESEKKRFHQPEELRQ